MSFRRFCCCCCCSDTESEADVNGPVGEEDYLLPGGAWDPSVSVARSRRSRRNTSRRRQGGEEEEEVNAYVPPDVPAATSLPNFNDFKLLKTVGKGAFGKVMLCVHTPTNTLYAMKAVPKAKITTQKQINQILAELRILKRIQHPFCVSLKCSFQDEHFLFYVFNYAAGGMLFYHLRQDGRFMEPRARFYLGEIILALDYLHGFNIIFRDLKPENCMLSEQGHVILTDFGSARTLEMRERANTLAGTPQYMAPEVLRGEPYNYSADWWSCGVLLFEMLTGKTPFSSADRADLYKMVLRGDFRVPSYISPRARSLLYKLINRDPEFRLGCGTSNQAQAVMEIKEHSFFSNTPMDPDEEAHYVTEEAERERHRQALERTRRSRQSSQSGSFMEAASSVIKNISRTTSRRLSGSSTYMGSPCEWVWEELERRDITPPFRPKLKKPTDLCHFDPIVTCIPANISDLITSDRHLHLEGFDYVTAGLAQAAQPGPAASGAAGAGDEGGDTGSHSGLDNHTETGDT